MLLDRTDERPRRRAGGLYLFVLLLLAVMLAPLPRAMAADQAPASAAVSDKEIDDLVRTLQDPAARDKLIQQLQALKAAQAQAAQPVQPQGLGAVLLASLSEQVRKVSDALVSAATAILDLPQALAWLGQQASDPAVRAHWLEVVLKIGLLLLVALAADWMTTRLLRGTHGALESRQADRFRLRLPLTIGRLLLELMPIVAFATFAYFVLPLTHPSLTTRLIALTIVNAYVIAQAIVAVARAILSPRAAALRLWRMSDETANYILIWVRRLTAISVYGYFFAEVGLLVGLPDDIYQLFLRVVGLLFVAVVIVVILQNRAAVANWLKGNGESGALSGVRQRIADVWHILAIVYIFAIYGVWALDIAGGFDLLLRATGLTIVVLLALRIVTRTLRRLVERGFALSVELKARFPGLEARANRYLPFLQTLLQGVIYFFVVLSLLEIWGLHAFDWLTSDFGRRIFGGLITIGIILLVALVLSELVNELVERLLRRNGTRWRDAAHNARMRTLLPLLRNAFRIVLIVMVTLVVLSQLGLDITPLLAGAGVVGLAIGFGAQTLVKDVITGIFILAEDTIAVGDVVDLGGHSGVVEAMSIRSIRVRDYAGAVHTIPFSAVSTVVNMTRDFGYAVFDVAVAYSVHLGVVVKTLQEIGAELQQDKTLGRDIRAPIEVLGINRFADTGVIVRARIKTVPGRQWGVESAFNERLKQRFDELGIVRGYALPAAPALPPAAATAAAT